MTGVGSAQARKGRKMNFRPLDVEDVEDKKRKERAAAKLQEIEERIARRQAEEQYVLQPQNFARHLVDSTMCACETSCFESQLWVEMGSAECAASSTSQFNARPVQ